MVLEISATTLTMHQNPDIVGDPDEMRVMRAESKQV